MKTNKGFTLVEMLLVVAIIAVVAVVVVLAINPANLFKGQRDANRVESLTTITNAVAFAKANGASIGTPGIAYVSVPDPTLTGNQTSTCSSLGLPAIASTTYQCVSAANLARNDGTGWLPIAFDTLPGSPLGALPVDPVNTTSSGEYFIYTTNGSGYETLANAEVASDTTNEAFAQGNDLALIGSFPNTITFTTSTLAGYGQVKLAFDSHTNTVWVANPNGNVTVINDITYASTTYAVNGASNATISFDPHTDTVWVAAMGGGFTLINDGTYVTSSYQPTQGGYNYIAFDSNTNTMWIAGSTNVIVINDLTLATSSQTVGSGLLGPLAFDSNTHTMWAANQGFTQINDATYETSSYAVAGGVGPLAFDSHTNTVWDVVGGYNSVAQINDATYATSSYAVGTTPFAVTFDSHTNSIWVPNFSDGTVTQINDTTYATTTYSAGAFPGDIAFDSHTNAIWVADYNGGTITVFTPNH